MRRGTAVRWLVVLWGVLWLTALASALQEPILQPGDTIRVTVEGEESLSRAYTLDAQGNIQMPLIGTVKAGGKTPSALAQEIARLLEEGRFLREPVVRVELMARPKAVVTVRGAVRKAGEFELRAGWRLSDVLNEAGPTAVADLTAVQLERADGTRITLNYRRFQQEGDESMNPLLQSGDQIFVPLLEERRTVTVLGAVRTPGNYPYDEAKTLIQALGKAGGTLPEADMAQITIRRANRPEPIVVNLNLAQSDFPLEAGDQITVPFRRVRQFVVVRGAVRKPGILDYYEGMTLTQALEAAGGATDKAILERITIQRPTARGKTQKITVNLLQVAQGTRPDEPLQGGDTVEVPALRERRASPEEPLRVLWLILSIVYLVTRN